MPPRRRGALQLVRREVDQIRDQVERLLKDLQSGTGPPEEALQRCRELQMSAEKTQRTLRILTKEDEPAPVGRYEQRKLEEEQRLQDVLQRLSTASLQLSGPPGPPGPSGPSAAAGEVSKEEDEEDEEDDEDCSDDDDDDDEEKPDPHIYTALSDFRGEQEGDLSVQRGQVLRITRKAADGWWSAQDANGNRGLVPKTYLKMGCGADDEEDDEDDEEEDEEDEEEEEEEEDGEELTDDGEKQSSPHANWSTVRKALSEVDATDVLSAMGAIPSGFRPSSLNKLLVEEGGTHRGSRYVQPELSQSQLSFSDLFLDPDTGKVRARQVRTSVCFGLWSCRMIPSPGVGVQVLSRHVRLCAFDGVQVLSNIHTVRATYNPKSPKTWSFSPRVTGVLPSLLDGECFLRCSAASPELGVLFELGVTFIRTSTGERGDLSCGWAFLKLRDDAGNPVPNRTYELQVNGGTPYEQQLEASASRGSPSSVFHQMLQVRKHPKLIVKLKSSNSRTRAQLSLLPDSLLHALSGLQLLVLLRQLQADCLLMDRPTMQSADLMCSPVLSTFPELLDQPDLLDALRSAWMDAESNMSRAQKRDSSFLKRAFVSVYLSSVYLLLRSASLPPPRWADPPSEEQRSRVIYATLDALRRSRHASGSPAGPEPFTDASHQHLAFDVAELTFDLLRVAR